MVLGDGRDNFASQRAKTTLHAVSYDRVADFLGHGKADACFGIAVTYVRNQNEARRNPPPALVRREKIRAARNRLQALSFLRPRLRRARITERPPTVDMR